MLENFISKNLIYLRELNNVTQSDVAFPIGKGHTTVGNWEKGKNPPTGNDLIGISHYFQITVDDLLLKDLKKEGYNKKIKNKKDAKIEGISEGFNEGFVVKNKRKAGQSLEDFVKSDEHLRHFGDVYDLEGNEAYNLRIFMTDQERFRFFSDLRLPDLGKGIHFRLKIKEDNMQPVIKAGDKVVVTYMPEHAIMLREGNIYIVLDKDDTIVCNRVYKADANSYELRSENKTYKPYKLPLKDIQAVFKVVEVHSRSLGTANTDPPLNSLYN